MVVKSNKNKIHSCLKIVNSDSYYDEMLDKDIYHIYSMLKVFNNSWMDKSSIQIIFDVYNNHIHFRSIHHPTYYKLSNQNIRGKMLVIGEVNLNRYVKNETLKNNLIYKSYLREYARTNIELDTMIEFLKHKSFKTKLNDLVNSFLQEKLSNSKSDDIYAYINCKILKEDSTVLQRLAASIKDENKFDEDYSIEEIKQMSSNLKSMCKGRQYDFYFNSTTIDEWLSKYYRNNSELFDYELKKVFDFNSSYRSSVNNIDKQIDKMYAKLHHYGCDNIIKNLFLESSITRDDKRSYLRKICGYDINRLNKKFSGLSNNNNINFMNFLNDNFMLNYSYFDDLCIEDKTNLKFYSDLYKTSSLSSSKSIDLFKIDNKIKNLYVKEENYNTFKQLISALNLDEKDFISENTNLTILTTEEYEKVKEDIV